MPARGPSGEERFIAEYLAPLAEGFDGALDLKDDCAFIEPLPGHVLVFKTDPVTAGVHFFSEDAPEDLAWKALATNVSDIAAKAARPVGYLMALSFPAPPSAEWMRRFADGLATAQSSFGCTLIGGDTDHSPGPQAIAITVIGEVKAGSMVPRAGAVPGDRIFVSGKLGASALGLASRLTPDRITGVSERALATARSRYLRPEPRLGMRAALGAHARTAMDISDGLIKDLDRMLRLAGGGAALSFEALPLAEGLHELIAQDRDFGLGLISAGDDYEILATVPADRAEQFATLAFKGGVTVSDIGEVRDTPGVVVTDRRAAIVEIGGGYDHFDRIT